MTVSRIKAGREIGIKIVNPRENGLERHKNIIQPAIQNRKVHQI